MTASCTPDCAFYSPAGGCPIHGGGPADSLTRPTEDLLEPADVERIEHLWEMGYGTSQHTMALIRTLRAAWAELGTVNGLVEYFGGLSDLAGEVKAVQIPVPGSSRPAQEPDASPDRDCVYIDVRDGQLTVTQTTGRTLALAVNGEFVAAPDRERTTIKLTEEAERRAQEPGERVLLIEIRLAIRQGLMAYPNHLSEGMDAAAVAVARLLDQRAAGESKASEPTDDEIAAEIDRAEEQVEVEEAGRELLDVLRYVPLPFEANCAAYRLRLALGDDPATEQSSPPAADLFAGIPEQLARLVAAWQSKLQAFADQVNAGLARMAVEPAAPKLAQFGPRGGCGPDCSEGHTYTAGCAIQPPARAFLGEKPCGKPGCPCGGARTAPPGAKMAAPPALPVVTSCPGSTCGGACPCQGR